MCGSKEGYPALTKKQEKKESRNEKVVLAAAKECKKIITCEEHSVIGGFGAAVCEVLEEDCPVPVRRIGVQDVFGHSGPMLEVMKDFGLCADNIVKQTKDFL